MSASTLVVEIPVQPEAARRLPLRRNVLDFSSVYQSVRSIESLS
jgi:hypothetical protein